MLGFKPGNLELYHLAFQHSSLGDGSGRNNERLEFLGDAVLDAIIADHLFLRYPGESEGFLTEMRSKMVSRNQLNDLALKLGLDEQLNFNQADKSLQKSSILGNALEAVIGAIYLDKGYDHARKYVDNKVIIPYLDLEQLEREEYNYKSRLIEWCQKRDIPIRFKVTSTNVIDGKNKYTIVVLVDDKEMGTGEGYSKKMGEQRAAEQAYRKINNDYRDDKEN
ncbi:MAG: ribonuclease III [Bacteroidetes bacterium]|nr:ribonuclease III [Bacteroidota bacterium]